MANEATSDTFTTSDEVGIYYRVWEGNRQGTPVVLHHGFISDGSLNWETTGVVEELAAVAGPIVALDARGHGRSAKPTDTGSYGERRMAIDLREVCSHLELSRFDLVGYSMGGVVGLMVAGSDPRVRRLVIGGLGASLAEGGVDSLAFSGEAVAEALAAEDARTITDPLARSFREFADSVGADRAALATHVRAAREGGIDLGAVSVPTLVLAGREDPMARDPEALASAIPGAELVRVPGDHIRAVGTEEFKHALVGFLTASRR